MIVTAFLNALYFVIHGVALLFIVQPDVAIGSDFSGAITNVAAYYSALDVIFPMPVLLGIVAFDTTFEGAYLFYKLVRWGYQKIPGIH